MTNRRLHDSRPFATLTHLATVVALSAAVLAGCSSEGASTDCGLDQCTVTFDRGVEGRVSVLGVDAKFISATGDRVTLEIAGERLSLTVGEQATEVAGLSVSLANVTDSQVAVRIGRGG